MGRPKSQVLLVPNVIGPLHVADEINGRSFVLTCVLASRYDPEQSCRLVRPGASTPVQGIHDGAGPLYSRNEQ